MQAANFIFKSIATSTRRSYSAGERQFIRFCLGHRLVSPGYNTTHYASHSFRIGAATTAGTAGLPDWLIKVLGRWRSDAYQSYILTPKETILQVPQNLASCPDV